jgi:hypothetical protein
MVSILGGSAIAGGLAADEARRKPSDGLEPARLSFPVPTLEDFSRDVKHWARDRLPVERNAQPRDGADSLSIRRLSSRSGAAPSSLQAFVGGAATPAAHVVAD